MNIYAGNLPYDIDNDGLKDIFSAYGTVDNVHIIIDRATDRSKGFGFIEMNNDEEAQKAIDALNDSDIGGRNLRVNEARPREKRF